MEIKIRQILVIKQNKKSVLVILYNYFKNKGYKLAFNYLKDRRFTDAIDISHYVTHFFYILKILKSSI
jgi:hypothetical protein